VLPLQLVKCLGVGIKQLQEPRFGKVKASPFLFLARASDSSKGRPGLAKGGAATQASVTAMSRQFWEAKRDDFSFHLLQFNNTEQ
jgi:hypothetical protein